MVPHGMSVIVSAPAVASSPRARRPRSTAAWPTCSAADGTPYDDEVGEALAAALAR